MSKYLTKFEHLFCPKVGAQTHGCPLLFTDIFQSPQVYAVKKTKNVHIEVQNVLLSRSPQRLDPNLCQHARYLFELNWTQCVPVLEWLKTGNELGVYIKIMMSARTNNLPERSANKIKHTNLKGI